MRRQDRTLSVTSLNTSQRRSSREPVSPGGKKTPCVDHVFNEQGGDEFGLQPGAAGGVGGFGNMPGMKKLLKALEGQFHLPASAI